MHVQTYSDRHQIKSFAFHEPVPCLLLHNNNHQIMPYYSPRSNVWTAKTVKIQRETIYTVEGNDLTTVPPRHIESPMAMVYYFNLPILILVKVE